MLESRAGFYSRLSAHQTELIRYNRGIFIHLYHCFVAEKSCYLFICDLFTDAVGSSVYVKSSGKWISEYRRSQMQF
jgi:hypothetical protein